MKTEKGFTTIEALIAIIVLVPFVIGTCEIIMFGFRKATTAKVATTVSKIIGIQGGTLNKAPDGYPGGEAGYYTPKELQTLIQKQLDTCGIQDGEWELLINRQPIISSSMAKKTAELDWMTEIEVTLKSTYSWPLVSSILNTSIDTPLYSNRCMFSEWKYNYDEWQGE